ncbi:MAG: YggS family pyridoxal phosphate-dependent enzyme [Phycisphaerae bacterium]|nr:YggS family pyridoxal phosphate-dependent enzyme [Phycisphaerae bacterium]
MAVTTRRISDNLSHIRDDIAVACEKARRVPADVSIVAVTKQVDFETVRHLLDAGLSEFGENRAAQLARRAEEMNTYLERRRTPLPAPVRWHMIGHLQRNKIKTVLPTVSVVHSVDSLRLAEALNKRAGHCACTVDAFVQVNCSEEPQKHGCAVGAASHLAEMMATMPHVRVVGLMTMAPLTDDAEAARPSFARLREIFEDTRREAAVGDHFRHLSMGMSQDYAVAVEEGATVLRIGSALFA